MSLWKKNLTKTDNPDFVKYKVNALRLFAKDEWFYSSEGAYRIFRTVYTRAELNETGLFAEFSFFNKLFDEENWTCKVRYVVDKLKSNTNTVEKHIIDDEFECEVLRETNLYLVSRGKKEPGFWFDGEYVWRAYIDGVKVLESTFYIYDLPHPDSSNNVFFEIEKIGLFESSSSNSDSEKPVLAKAFKQGETRFVNVEVTLKNKLNFDWQCELFYYFLKETGNKKSVISSRREMKPGRNIWSNGRGNDNKLFWTPGKYSVRVVFMDRLMAVIPFEIGDEFVPGDAEVLNPGENLTLAKSEVKSAEEIKLSLEEQLKELNSLIGLEQIKSQINDYVGYLKFTSHRKNLGIEAQEKISLHAILQGNPGTGKTTIAKMLGGIYKALGLLSKGHVYEVDRADLVAEFVGQTAPKVKKAIERARGGILFIDEAYSLVRSGEDSKDFGQEVIEILLKEMSDGPGDIAILAAGYPEEMKRFIDFNPGLKSRFSTFFHFADYTPEEMLSIARSAMAKRHLAATPEAEELLFTEFTRAYRDRNKTFGNARYVISVVDEAKMNMALRLVREHNYQNLSVEELSKLTLSDVQQIFGKNGQPVSDFQIDKELLEEAMNDLNSLTGLQSVKQSVQEMVKLVKYYRETGKNVLNQFSMHALYVGNPGTGKTTVARIMAKIFRALGVVERGHVVECDRASLVAGYVGQTSVKTAEMVEKSLGGILFIDEAYSLNQGPDDNFGKESVNTLLKRMEDLRDEFIVIAAGYPQNMNEFLNSNPGLRSRFEHYFVFEDYTADELYHIGISMLLKENLVPDAEAAARLKHHFAEMFNHKQDMYFGNAREVRKVIQQAVRNQHLRMAGTMPENRTPELMETLLPIDLADLKTIDTTRKENPAIGFKR